MTQQKKKIWNILCVISLIVGIYLVGDLPLFLLMEHFGV